MSAGTLTAQTITATMTNAEFRALGAHIASILDAAGFVRTADTGQIDWATVNYPGVNSTDAGYEIRALADTIQGTAPIVVKLNYGRGSGTTHIRINFTVGSGSNGTGTITGQQLTETAFELFGAAGTDWNFSVSAGTNRFAMMWYRSPTGTQLGIFTFERTADADRTPNNMGSIVIYAGTPTTPGGQWSRYVPRSGTLPAIETAAMNCFPPAAQTTGLHSSGDVAVYPVFAYGVGEIPFPSLNVVGCFHTNFTAFNDYTLNIRGTNQVMRRCNFNSTSHNTTSTNARSLAFTVFNLMMRYD